MTDSNATELLPCAHCGCNTPWLEDIEHTQGLRWYVFCHVCGVTGGQKRTQAEAVKSWNTRTPEQAVAVTLGAPTLTAEQVEEAVRRNIAFCECSEEDVQAIADELNATLGVDDSRWFELFGAPERAARTICRQLRHYNICICDGCPVKPPNRECDSEYDALLEWLRGKAVKR